MATSTLRVPFGDGKQPNYVRYLVGPATFDIAREHSHAHVTVAYQGVCYTLQETFPRRFAITTNEFFACAMDNDIERMTEFTFKENSMEKRGGEYAPTPTSYIPTSKGGTVSSNKKLLLCSAP